MLHTLRLKTSPSQRYSIYFKDKGTHVLGFKNKEHAQRCATFLALYKHRYREYPPVDSQSVQHSAPMIPLLRESFDWITKDIQIIDEKEYELKALCQIFNVGLLEVEDFTYIFHTESVHVNYSASSDQHFDADAKNYDVLKYLYYKDDNGENADESEDTTND